MNNFKECKLIAIGDLGKLFDQRAKDSLEQTLSLLYYVYIDGNLKPLNDSKLGLDIVKHIHADLIGHFLVKYSQAENKWELLKDPIAKKRLGLGLVTGSIGGSDGKTSFDDFTNAIEQDVKNILAIAKAEKDKKANLSENEKNDKKVNNLIKSLAKNIDQKSILASVLTSLDTVAFMALSSMVNKASDERKEANELNAEKVINLKNARSLVEKNQASLKAIKDQKDSANRAVKLEKAEKLYNDALEKLELLQVA